VNIIKPFVNSRLLGKQQCMHAECPDYDLCQNCEALPIAVHPPNHPMLKMKTPDTVVPMVYRLGQRNFNQERKTSNAVSEQKTCNSVEIPVTTCVSPVHSPARIETPTPTSVRNVVTSQNLQQSSLALADNVTFPTSLNPFADIFAADYTPGFSHGVPSVNPWPTIDHCERNELIPRIVDFSGPYASDAAVNNICEKRPVYEDKVEKDLVQMSEKSSLLDQLSRTPSQPSTPVVPATKVAVAFGDASASVSRGSSLAECKEALEIDRVFDKFFAPTVPSASEERSKSPPVAEESNGQSAKPQSVTNDPEKYEGDSSSGSSDLQLFSVHEAIANLIRELPLLVPAPAPTLAEAEISPSRVPVPLSAVFIEDVTVSDGQVFPPGAEFVKCWRLMNDSEREWPESTELVFLAGDTLSAAKADALAEDKPVVVSVGKTAPGQIVDIWTGELKAPEIPGRYVGYWRLKADGVLFGNSLWVEYVIFSLFNIQFIHLSPHLGSPSPKQTSLMNPWLLLPSSCPPHRLLHKANASLLSL
jgi:next-to-BRCA1 protein 1